MCIRDSICSAGTADAPAMLVKPWPVAACTAAASCASFMLACSRDQRLRIACVVRDGSRRAMSSHCGDNHNVLIRAMGDKGKGTRATQARSTRRTVEGGRSSRDWQRASVREPRKSGFLGRLSWAVRRGASPCDRARSHLARSHRPPHTSKRWAPCAAAHSCSQPPSPSPPRAPPSPPWAASCSASPAAGTSGCAPRRPSGPAAARQSRASGSRAA
eukprot:1379403-Prymnesium_polylepis.1